jgi:hypothetical protein
MMDDMTVGARGAVAGTRATGVATGEVVGTVVVYGALGPLALLVGVAEEALPAVAARLVVAVDLAECVIPALGYQAGVDALAVDAGLGEGALVTTAAAN